MGANATVNGQPINGQGAPTSSTTWNFGAPQDALSPQVGESYTPQTTQSGQPNIFGTSAGAFNTGVANLQGGGGMNPLTAYGAGQLMSQNPYEQQAARGYQASMGPGIVPATMNQYLNPYQGQVINDTLTRMRESELQDLNMVRAQAAQSGAFGGARQGLVESQLMDRYNQNAYQAVGQMNQQGFNTAAQLGQSRIGQIQAGAGGLANLGGMQSNNATTLANLGLSQNQQQLASGQALVGAGQTGLGMGNQLIGQQAQAGAQQQGLMQQILGQATGQYDQFVNYPQASLGMALAGVQGNPLQAATTTTTRMQPGLFNYLSLGAGLGSSYLGGPAMGGK